MDEGKPNTLNYRSSPMEPMAEIEKVHRILSSAFAIHGFPAFCALLVGSSTLLHVVLKTMIVFIAPLFGCRAWQRQHHAIFSISHFLSTLISAWLAMPLLGPSEERSPGAVQSLKAGEKSSRADTIDLST